jgi:hypothetical protein
VITDVSVPGTGYDRWREEFETNLWSVTLAARLRREGDGVRPSARAGAGVYLFRTRDEIDYYNQGVEVPELRFEQTRSEAHPGLNLGGGLDWGLGSSSWTVGLDGRVDVVLGAGPGGVLAHPLGRLTTVLAYGF